MFGDLDEKEKKLKSLPVQYVCAEKEICPSTGREHLQGYLYSKNPLRLKSMKMIDGQAKWLPQKGSFEQAAIYTLKEGKWWEVGTRPHQGERTDYKEVAVKVRNGAALEEIAEEHPEIYVRYSRGLESLQSRLMKHRTERPKVTWLWGGTGVGKTLTATRMEESFYFKDGTKWWDGYTQQKCIIIDDFEDNWEPGFRDLLRLLDINSYQGQSKGGHVKINSPQIVITSEFSPSYFWQGTKLAQVMRRINEGGGEVRHLSGTEVAQKY